MGASIVVTCDRCGVTKALGFSMEHVRSWDSDGLTSTLIRDAGWDFMLSRDVSEYVYLCPACKVDYESMKERHDEEKREMSRRHASELAGFMYHPPSPTVVDE